MSSSTTDSRPNMSKSWLHQLKILKQGFPQSLPGANYASFPMEGHICYYQPLKIAALFLEHVISAVVSLLDDFFLLCF